MSSGESFATAIAALRTALELFGACDTQTATDAEIAEALSAAEVLAAGLDGERLRLLRDFDRRGLAAVHGATSTTAWLRHTTRMAASTASARVRVARTVAHMPAFGAALAEGQVGFDHARVVAALAA